VEPARDVEPHFECQQAGVPITNYGLTIAYSLGIFRARVAAVPAALEFYRNANSIKAGLQPGAEKTPKSKLFQQLCPPAENPLKPLETSSPRTTPG